MSDFPTTAEETKKEITELLENIPSTSERGRVLHLLDYLNTFNTGSSGVSLPSTTLKIGDFVLTTDFNTIAANQMFVDNSKLVISNQVGADVSDRMPFDFLALQSENDFYFILTGSMDGFDFSLVVDSYSLHSGYALEDEFTYVGHNTMMPPITDGTDISIYAVPKPKGSKTTSIGSLSFDVKITAASASSPDNFQSTLPSSGHAAFNSADTSSASILYIKGDDNRWSEFSKFDGRGLYGGNSPVVIEIYQNGVLIDQIVGTGSSDSGLDLGTGIKTFNFSNRSSINGLTLDPANGAIEARVFINYG